MMPKLTFECQSSFVPHRQATDNIIIVQEVVHTLRKRKGKVGSFIAKIDLEKAYDRIEWSFLNQLLAFLDFSHTITKLILHCISSAQLSLIWNGKVLPSFQPSHGLRQGDPLSPYLFVLCMETLAHRIQQACTLQLWKPIKFCRTGPELSHVFYADDLLLMGEASEVQARTLKEVLVQFCRESGQRVNYSKSRL